MRFFNVHIRYHENNYLCIMKYHKKNKKKHKSITIKNVKETLKGSIRLLFEKNTTAEFSISQLHATMNNTKRGVTHQLIETILAEFVKQGFIIQTPAKTYTINSEQIIIEGVLSLNQRGAGFVTNGTQRDIYIDPSNIGRAIGGDKVQVQLIRRHKTRIEGKIIRIIERLQTQFVGVIQKQANYAFFIPDNYKVGVDIMIPKEKINGAKNGEKVLVKITSWPASAKKPYGEVIERLGHQSANDTEMLSILASQGIDFVFDQQSIDQAKTISMELQEEEIQKRRDMRSVLTFTIDPEDAKDFDDAISFQRLDSGLIEIGVHIADVSHYLPIDSPLDKEALKRSNSVYLVDRVIPMLPEELSNFACSLRPNEDKYSFSVIFQITEKGKIEDVWFGKTVIHSNKRLSYQQAQEIIDGKNDALVEEIKLLNDIAKIIRKKRIDNGALNIETEEIRFQLDERNNPINVILKKSEDAHKLIEEFMLLANLHVAERIGKPEKNKNIVPLIYRVHDLPDTDKIEQLKVFIEKFGHKLNTNHPQQAAKAINELLNQIKKSNEYTIIQSMVIRSMAKAVYQTDNIGHYGLAFRYYTHFTSPIRRYADLVVHRILQAELTQQKHSYNTQLDEISKRVSRNERKAIEAERESLKYFQTVFIKDKIGEQTMGTIYGIADQGMFIRMDDNFCEGMIPITDIPGDYYSFDPKKYKIIGINHQKEYNIGDRLKVKISGVSLKKRQIDLELIN